MTETRLTFALIARVPTAGLSDFLAYEDAVLPLLARHGGALERRLRTAAGRTEIHVVSFPDAEAFDSYRADPDRAELADLLERSGAEMELLTVIDVDD